LFIKYQIPSDLVSYDGPANESVEVKTGRVREYVQRVHTMLELCKKAELEEAEKQQQLRLPQAVPPSPLSPLFAARVIQENIRAYLEFKNWVWWRLYSKSRPLLCRRNMDKERGEVEYIQIKAFPLLLALPPPLPVIIHF
jgi:hypothetical protein